MPSPAQKMTNSTPPRGVYARTFKNGLTKGSRTDAGAPSGTADCGQGAGSGITAGGADWLVAVCCSLPCTSDRPGPSVLPFSATSTRTASGCGPGGAGPVIPGARIPSRTLPPTSWASPREGWAVAPSSSSASRGSWTAPHGELSLWKSLSWFSNVAVPSTAGVLASPAWPAARGPAKERTMPSTLLTRAR